MEVILAILAMGLVVAFLAALTPIALAAGGLYGLFVSVRSFIHSFTMNIDPYETYVDKSPRAVPGCRRSYFFGPGYHQIAVTVSDAFAELSCSVDALLAWKESMLAVHGLVLSFFAEVAFYAGRICIYVFGGVWIALFSVLLFAGSFIGMCGFYVFFSLLWLADRITLLARSIQSRCPYDKRISVVPIFCCPDCGAQHFNLTPGPYGVLKQKCVCGSELPTTIFNGRSRLKAQCPYCHTPLAISDAKQFGIQLVGGMSAGKTTFLASFWHYYIEKLRNDKNLEFSCVPEEAFDELESWYQNGTSKATNENNANMYSIIHRREGSIPVQMTIYDVAGESFTSTTAEVQQQQFKYCEGIIIVVDPTATLELNMDTISGFVNDFKQIRGVHASQLSQIPVSVVISKSDLFKKEIGVPKIKSIYNKTLSETEELNITYEGVRNEVCSSFLTSHGFGAVLNKLESEFGNIQYFAVSAMGHDAENALPYEPWGVMEPVSWIVQQSQVQL